jgi:hypothetical protein
MDASFDDTEALLAPMMVEELLNNVKRMFVTLEWWLLVIGMSITRNTRSWDGMTILIHSFGGNAWRTKLPYWNGIRFKLNFLKYPKII